MKARTSAEATVRPGEEPQAMGGGPCPGSGVSKPRWVTLKKGEFNGKRMLDPVGETQVAEERHIKAQIMCFKRQKVFERQKEASG